MINTLPNAVGLLLQNVDGELKNGIETATIITSWIRQCYKVDDDLSAPLFVMRTRLATIRNDELDKYKIFLVFYLQYRRNLEYVNDLIYISENQTVILIRNCARVFFFLE